MMDFLFLYFLKHFTMALFVLNIGIFLYYSFIKIFGNEHFWSLN